MVLNGNGQVIVNILGGDGKDLFSALAAGMAHPRAPA
jgi:hypothetical protein